MTVLELNEQMTKKEQAQAIIGEARSIHLHWIKFLKKEPQGGDICPPIETAGGGDHHQDWVDKYDLVLEALKL